MVSYTAWYPTRHGILHSVGMPSGGSPDGCVFRNRQRHGRTRRAATAQGAAQGFEAARSEVTLSGETSVPNPGGNACLSLRGSFRSTDGSASHPHSEALALPRIGRERLLGRLGCNSSSRAWQAAVGRRPGRPHSSLQPAALNRGSVPGKTRSEKQRPERPTASASNVPERRHSVIVARRLAAVGPRSRVMASCGRLSVARVG
jgi:hypothetical protein